MPLSSRGREVAADLGSADKPVNRKPGKMLQWLKEKEQSGEEQARIKHEKMNELYQQRMAEKAQQQQQAQGQQKQ